MPSPSKKSHGQDVQSRVKSLLEAILACVSGEKELGRGLVLKHSWAGDEKVLMIETTLQSLVLLSQPTLTANTPEFKRAKAQAGEALHDLRCFVAILDDHRVQKKGSDRWHFSLHLWGKDRDHNLAEFDKLWESKRSPASKLKSVPASQPKSPFKEGSPFPMVRLPEDFIERTDALNIEGSAEIRASQEVRSMRLANRTKEVELFKKMVLGKIHLRILLIQAASGMGKTSLLAEFSSLFPVHTEAAILVKVDLKSTQTSIDYIFAYIFSKLQNRLGENKFTRFNDVLVRFLNAGMEIAKNQIEGTENQIQMVLNAENKDIRNSRLKELQSAFFRDLQAIEKPIVMLLDTFNESDLDVADWIGGIFLTEVAETKNIRVVIAGQSVPKLKIEWAELADIYYLNEIRDIEAWHQFVQSRELPFELPAVKAFVKILNGNPDQITKVFESYAGGWKHE
jgi:hypothetical protein